MLRSFRALLPALRPSSQLSAVLLAATWLAAPTSHAADSWDAVPHDANGAVTVADDLVVQQRADGSVEVFGSSARTWRTLGAAGADLVGVGARTALVRDGGVFRAYSAVRDASADLLVPLGATVVSSGVGDDVALVVLEDGGARTAHGYSPRSGTWNATPLVGALGDVVIGGSVAGVAVGSDYLGFSANVAVWSTEDALFGGGDLTAAGSVLLVDQRANGGPITNALAFSGTRGCWAASPPVATGTSIARDADVACVVVGTVGAFSTVAYSAPRATWVPSSRSYLAPPSVDTARGVLGVRNAAGGLVEAFGAECAAWAEPSATLPAGTFALAGDAVVGCNPLDDVVEGFSGLVGGGFVQRHKPLGASADLHVGAHLAVLELDRGPWKELHAFAPSSATFATPLVLAPNAPVFVGDCVVHAIGSAALGYALAARDGVWRGFGAVLPDGTIGSTVAVGGSVVAHQRSDGTVEVYDERCGRWNATFDQGVVHTHTAGANLVLATPNSTAGRLRAYASARGAWIEAVGAVGPVAALGAAANVAAGVDAAGDLWAFGATNDTRALRAWPLDDASPVAGIHPFAPPGAAACFDDVQRITALGRAGEVSLCVIAPFASCPPVTVPGIGGELWLSQPTAQILAPIGPHVTDGIRVLPLGLGGLPVGETVRAHVQALFVELGTFAVRFAGGRSEAVTLH